MGYKSGHMLELQPKKPLFEALLTIFKKLVLILANFAPVIEASKKANIILEQIPYINYLLCY